MTQARLDQSDVSSESGATLIIVVLSLLALFGMMVLVVDVGSLLYARRAMVNGSDAAALAAAQSCAGTADSDSPEAFADMLATANSTAVNAAVTNITDSVNCDSGAIGWVSVEYSKSVELFFAGVLGAEDTNDVTTEATAHWGPAGGTHPIPIVVNEGALQGNCTIPEVAIGTRCYIWEDNDILSGGNFGFLDVGPQWNVDAGYPCNNVGGTPTIEDWVSGTTVIETLDLNYPFATYVCARDGNRTPVWRALEKLVGRTFDFPINGISPADGATVIANPSGTTQKYNIIGFARLLLVDVLEARHSNPVHCNNVTIPPTATLPLDLMALGRSSACPTMPAGAVFVAGSAHPSPGNVTMIVDDTGHVTSWSEPPSKISFDYTVLECGGIEAPNASGHCLVLEWRGAQMGGSHPGGGADFGLRAISLCDRTIGSCLEPSS